VVALTGWSDSVLVHQPFRHPAPCFHAHTSGLTAPSPPGKVFDSEMSGVSLTPKLDPAFESPTVEEGSGWVRPSLFPSLSDIVSRIMLGARNPLTPDYVKESTEELRPFPAGFSSPSDAPESPL